MSLADLRKTWARRYIAAAPQAPAYGSAEWLALPDGPEKVAAVVRAAESWATDGDNLMENLAAELDARHASIEEDVQNAEWIAQREAHTREWSNKSWRPHPANRRGAA